MKPLFTVLALTLVTVIAPPLAAAQQAPEWVLQEDESALTFTASQSGSPIKGRFESFEADIRFDPDDPTAGSLKVTIDMASATTDDSSRDKTLKSASLFHVTAHPTGTFTAARFETASGENAYRAPGELTLRGVTKTVTLPFTLSIEGSGAGAVAHATGGLTIDRLDYGIGQGEWADTTTVADPVEIAIDIHAVRQ